MASNTCAPSVRRHRGDAHLGHHLQDPLAEAALMIVRTTASLERDRPRMLPLGDACPRSCLHGQVRVDGRGAVAHQQACSGAPRGQSPLSTMRLTRRARLLADEVMVNRRHHQQRRDRERASRLESPVADRMMRLWPRWRWPPTDLGADLGRFACAHALAALGDREQAASRGAARKPEHVAVVVDVHQLGQVVVVQDRATTARSAGQLCGLTGRSRLPSGPD